MSEFDQEWKSRIDAIGEEPSEQDLGVLLQDMVRQATAPGRAVAQLATDEGRQALWRRLGAGLDFCGLLGSLYSEPPADPAARSWGLAQQVEIELHLRGQLVHRLVEALGDKREVARPQPVGHEEIRPPPLRVCDEAYLGLRRLLHPEEDLVGFSVDADGYLAMPFDVRDQAIAKALATKTWNLSPFEFY